MKKSAQVITRLASAGFAVVFVALILSTIWGATTMRRATARTLAAVTISERYEVLERELAAEASLVRVHGFDPQGSGWNEMRPAAIQTEATLATIARIGSERDRAAVRATLADHDRYLDVLLVLFSQIDNDVPGVAASFKHSIALANRMSERIDVQAAAQHDAAVAALDELDATQGVVVRTILIASLFGFALITLCLVVVARYRRDLESARKDELDRLARASLTDLLTGLGNGRAFADDLAREVAALGRHRGFLTLALIDIDHFKDVNDCHGHMHGDLVLAALGELLLTIRRSDRAYRLGGDEFAVILPFTTAAEAFTVMDRLRRAAPGALHGSTLSIGLSAMTDRDIDPTVLRAQADAALYEAKGLGRDTVIAYGWAQDAHEASPPLRLGIAG